ncbi:MAG: hypothetical protein AB1410_00075 [Acidobacteriota bacterium]
MNYDRDYDRAFDSLKHLFEEFIQKRFDEKQNEAYLDVYKVPIKESSLNPLDLLEKAIASCGGLRKLAREIEYSPSYLSQCLHGKKPLSKRIVNAIKDKLKNKGNSILEKVNKEPEKVFTYTTEKDLVREKIRELKASYLNKIVKSRIGKDYIRANDLRKELEELGILIWEQEIFEKIREILGE